MNLQEIRDKQRALEYDQSRLAGELKTVRSAHHHALVAECTKELTERQAAGTLTPFAIQVALNDLAGKLKELYDK